MRYAVSCHEHLPRIYQHGIMYLRFIAVLWRLVVVMLSGIIAAGMGSCPTRDTQGRDWGSVFLCLL